MTSFEVQNLSYRFASQPLLQDISLTISDNEMVTFSGPNGSGKSTLLRLMAGLLRLQSGSIRLEGKDLSLWSARERAQRISWMPQQPSVLAPWPVIDYLVMGYYPRRRLISAGIGAEERFSALEYLRMLEIEELAEKSFHHLSGGEQQLVRIARCLAQETPILLLDEPFAPLDLARRIHLQKILPTLHRTVIVVSHDLSMLPEGTSRLILLKEGRILAEGSPESVLTDSNIREAFKLKSSDAVNLKLWVQK